PLRSACPLGAVDEAPDEEEETRLVREDKETFVENLAIRRRVFTEWVNLYLQERKLRVKEGRLTTGALSNGVVLANLYEVVSGRMLPLWNAHPKSREERVANVELV